MSSEPHNPPVRSGVIAICGNPNSGKTTIFNAITGLNQQVGNYPGVTVEKVTGPFQIGGENPQRLTLIDIPGTYSLSAYTPDEYIAASALFGDIEGEPRPDAIIAVIDATNLERSLYLLLQVMQIGRPVVVALNMSDIAEKRGIVIDHRKLSELLGGVAVVPVVGNRGVGIEDLKLATVNTLARPQPGFVHSYDAVTDSVLDDFVSRYGNTHRSRAHYLRVIFDVKGPAERKFLKQEGDSARDFLETSRQRIKDKFGTFSYAETRVLAKRAGEIYARVVSTTRPKAVSRSEKIDRFLLHPVLGPVVLVLMMLLVFQSIFSGAEPFMRLIESAFSALASLVAVHMADGPLRSLLTDGIIGGVGSVLVFIPQIAILFIFIALLEDTGYMTRAAFLVDRMFRWCGLSGKSFIPMLSSFACAVPGIMATRTIEDRKLRLMTILVAPLMTCSARLPIYSILIAAFIPYKMFLGFINLQGLVLALLYLLGIVVAVMVSFVLKKIIHRTERGTFLMEMPSYKLPMLRSIGIRVANRVKTFVLRAGTVILAIAIIIWALSYYPHSAEVTGEYQIRLAGLDQQYAHDRAAIDAGLASVGAGLQVGDDTRRVISSVFSHAGTEPAAEQAYEKLVALYPTHSSLIAAYMESRLADLRYRQDANVLANWHSGRQMRESLLGRAGRILEPVFEPLGWDWKITVSVMAAFPAREVVIATLGTIYNLGSGVSEHSLSLIDKLRSARWEGGGAKEGQPVFSTAVALSVMVFFALCCQCSATVVTMKQETTTWLYPLAAFGYMTVLAYGGAFVTYRIVHGLGW